MTIVLFTANGVAPSTGDGDFAVKARLESRGFGVVVGNVDAPGTLLQTSALAIVAASEDTSSNIGNVKDATIPVINLRSETMALAGMASPPSFQKTTLMAIAEPSHAVAAGLSGSVGVVTSDRTIGYFPTLPATATKVATIPADITRVTLFAYDVGQAMSSGTAPARRVGFFFTRESDVPFFAPDGWKLFDAAVDWAIELSIPPDGGAGAGGEPGAGGQGGG